MRIAVSIALLAALAAAPAMAETKKHSPAKSTKTTKAAPAAPAKPSLATLAAEGDPEAQLALGRALASGQGMRADPAEATYWLALAAANGQAAGALDLAQGYQKGAFGAADPAKAALWFYRAGQLGDQSAQQRFLSMFLDGTAPSIIGPSGVKWLEQLAEAGDEPASVALGHIYETGDGVVADLTKAQRWYRRGAYAGDAEAQMRLGRMLLSETGAWRLLSKDASREADNPDHGRLFFQRGEAVQSAGNDRWVDIMRPGMINGQFWLERAAAQGEAEAARRLGLAYLGGLDLPFDIDQATRWLSIAAIQGDGPAAMAAAGLAATGSGLFGPDPLRAWVDYDIAATQGVSGADDTRDKLGKTLAPRQLARARQIAADVKAR